MLNLNISHGESQKYICGQLFYVIESKWVKGAWFLIKETGFLK
jgi:hypothetical protein